MINTIKHGLWTFDYDTKKSNIYSTNLEMYDDFSFKYNNDSIINKYDGNKQYLTEYDLNDFRRAANIHKIARNTAKKYLITGGKIADLVDNVYDIILKLCKLDGNTYFINGAPYDNFCGIAFPVGVNINNVVAHDSKTFLLDDDRTFCLGDVVKIDIGVHVNGRIIDSAFTHIITNSDNVNNGTSMNEDNLYFNLLEASRESMINAIKMASPDQNLLEMSETINEIIESYEISIGNDILPIYSVKGIGGHNIEHYKIHANKMILSFPDSEIQKSMRMEEDEVYAIETFATTGTGELTQETDATKYTHFIENKDVNDIKKKEKKQFEKFELYNWLQKTRRGLPFCSEWLEKTKIPKLEKSFKLGVNSGQIMIYPPLYDIKGSVVSQFEHTIHVKDGSAIEIFSLSSDY